MKNEKKTIALIFDHIELKSIHVRQQVQMHRRKQIKRLVYICYSSWEATEKLEQPFLWGKVVCIFHVMGMSFVLNQSWKHKHRQ